MRGQFDGVVVTNNRGYEYALGIAKTFEPVPGGGQWACRTGGDLGGDGGYCANLGRVECLNHPFPGLPQVLNQPGDSAGVELELSGKQETTVRFILTWYCPTWKGGAG